MIYGSYFHECLTCTFQYYYLIGARGESNAIFGQGSGPIWHSNVSCSGTEGRLLDCSTGAVGGHTCSHSDDAGVTCNTSMLCIPSMII